MIHMTNNELLEFKNHRLPSCSPLLHDKLIDCSETCQFFSLTEEGETMEEWFCVYMVGTENTTKYSLIHVKSCIGLENHILESTNVL